MIKVSSPAFHGFNNLDVDGWQSVALCVNLGFQLSQYRLWFLHAELDIDNKFIVSQITDTDQQMAC